MDNFVHEAQTETYKEQSTIINMKYGIFNLQKTEDVYVLCTSLYKVSTNAVICCNAKRAIVFINN